MFAAARGPRQAIRAPAAQPAISGGAAPTAAQRSPAAVAWDIRTVAVLPPRPAAAAADPGRGQPLRIGRTDDPLEGEADRIATAVMSGTPVGAAAGAAPQQVARSCAACRAEDEAAVRRSPAAAQNAPSIAPSIVHDVLRSPGRPIDAATRRSFDARFGFDFSRVRLHADAAAAASARAVQARAYTVGQHIVLGPGQSEGAAAANGLLAHELAHVVQQDRGAPAMLARAHDPHQSGSSRAVQLGELHDLLVALLNAVKRKTQLSLMGYKTIAVGLVEAVDEAGADFQTLVYTASGNWGSVDLETEAAKLGITRWIVGGRDEGRGATGAPNDAEQLLIEGQDQADMTLLGMAVSRAPCLDCADAIRDADVETVFVDPAKHLPKRQRASKRKPSAQLDSARSEIAQAFGPQLVEAGQEATAGLGPKAAIWGALNVLDIRELYQALEEADRAGHLAAIQAKAGKAEIDSNRILAAADAINLKQENLKQKGDALRQAIVSDILAQRLALLPPDQAAFILNQLYPHLHLATPPRQAPPKRQQPKQESPLEKAKDSSSYVGQMAKALAAAGVTAAALEAMADTLLAIAGSIFTKVVLRATVEGAAQVRIHETIVREAEAALQQAGPKLRVVSEAVRHRIPEIIADEITPTIERVLHVATP